MPASYIEATYTRPWHDRLLRSLLAHMLPYPNRFRFALGAAMLAKPLQGRASARCRCFGAACRP